jgi:hypothetical protein
LDLVGLMDGQGQSRQSSIGLQSSWRTASPALLFLLVLYCICLYIQEGDGPPSDLEAMGGNSLKQQLKILREKLQASAKILQENDSYNPEQDRLDQGNRLSANGVSMLAVRKPEPHTRVSRSEFLIGDVNKQNQPAFGTNSIDFRSYPSPLRQLTIARPDLPYSPSTFPSSQSSVSPSLLESPGNGLHLADWTPAAPTNDPTTSPLASLAALTPYQARMLSLLMSSARPAQRGPLPLELGSPATPPAPGHSPLDRNIAGHHARAPLPAPTVLASSPARPRAAHRGVAAAGRPTAGPPATEVEGVLEGARAALAQAAVASEEERAAAARRLSLERGLLARATRLSAGADGVLQEVRPQSPTLPSVPHPPRSPHPPSPPTPPHTHTHVGRPSRPTHSTKFGVPPRVCGCRFRADQFQPRPWRSFTSHRPHSHTHPSLPPIPPCYPLLHLPPLAPLTPPACSLRPSPSGMMGGRGGLLPAV